MKKAQSAMEYLMTYGWAILIVIIVAAALYALGIFNPATYMQSTATGFTGFQVPTGGWQASGDTVTLILNNMAGSNINVTSIVATYGTSDSTSSNPTYAQMAPNEQQQFAMSLPAGTGPTSGASYSISVAIAYDNLDTGLSGFQAKGTITGTAS